MFITKDLKKEIDYLSHKRDICQQKVINFNNKIKPLKKKFQSLKLFNECKIVSKDLLHIRNFNFIPGWSHYDINGNIVNNYSEISRKKNKLFSLNELSLGIAEKGGYLGIAKNIGNKNQLKANF